MTWADWMSGKDINPISSIHFIFYWFLSLTTNPMHAYVAVFAFLSTALSAGSNGEFIFILSIELKLAASQLSSRLPVKEPHPLFLAYMEGLLWVLRMCGCKPGWVPSFRKPLTFLLHERGFHRSSLNGRWWLFLKSSIWEESILSYWGASWPPNGFLVENFNARHLPLSPLASYVLSGFSWSGQVVIFNIGLCRS